LFFVPCCHQDLTLVEDVLLSLNIKKSVQLAHRLSLQAIEVYAISIGALLRDVGKIRSW